MPGKKKKITHIRKSVQQVVNEVNRVHGPGTIALVKGNVLKSLQYKRLKTGIFALDLEMGGGIPMGRMLELFGPLSSGKSTISYHAIAAVQRKKTKNKALLVDLEGTFDPDWAEKCGVNLKELYIVLPNYAEKGLDIADEMVRTGELGIFVLDSLGGVSASKELTTSMEEQQMAINARLANKFVRKVTMALQPSNLEDPDSRNECIVMILNQMRETMDQYTPVNTPGGKGKEYHSSIRIWIRRGSWITPKKKKRPVGHEIHANFYKNKTFAQRRVCVFDFYFRPAYGIKAGNPDNMKSIILYAIELGLVKQAGSYYKYKGRSFQGEVKIVNYLKKKPKTLKEMRKLIYGLFKKEVNNERN